MSYKRILTIQDISCLGQCSLAVALPVISACGHETCIIPSAVLSTHTGNFTGYTFRDLSEDIPCIMRHWEKEKISFDAIYTGYLGRASEVAYVLDIFRHLLKPDGKIIVDPAMGDNGKLYRGFDADYAETMKELCSAADVLLPNVTEAAILTGHEYRKVCGREYTDALARDLKNLGAGAVVITGVSYEEDSTGVCAYSDDGYKYFKHRKIPRMFHGTGDLYASSFTGAYLRGKSLFEAAEIAEDFTVEAINNSLDDEKHWYGTKFETALPFLMRRLGL